MLALAACVARASATATATARYGTARDACLQPFGPRSIWNLPLGADARLVPAAIHERDHRFPQLSVDPDVLVLSSSPGSAAAPERCGGGGGGGRGGGGGGTAPVTPVVHSSGDGWGSDKGERCAAATVGGAARPFFSAPIPKDFIVPDCQPRGSCSHRP
jgi:hypothetical protein